MKKTLLLIGIFLLSLSSYGQDSQVDFGIKGGLNYSSFIDNNDDDIPAEYKGKIGFQIGGFVEFGISEKISIRPELLYSQQGSVFTMNGRDFNIFDPNDDIIISSINGEIKESLLLLPFIVEYRLSETFNLEFGPQFGYSLNRVVELDTNPLGGGFIRNDDKEKFELGLGLGVGYSLSDDLGIYLRYNYGVIERQNLNTSVIQLGMNYKL
jgi:opacity protein-like surface antigen